MVSLAHDHIDLGADCAMTDCDVADRSPTATYVRQRCDIVAQSPTTSSASSAVPPHHSQQSVDGAGLVQICINDVSVDGLVGCDDVDDDEEEDDLNLEAMRRGQKRRLSWCPENDRKREEKEETQKMLGISGRRFVCDPLGC
jgi:hypothetical protein